MLHPSYTELIAAVNKNAAEGEEPVVNSRYSIVIATAKRARQLIAGEEPLVDADEKKKPLSVAVDELYDGKVQILPEGEEEEEAGEDWTEEFETEEEETEALEAREEALEAREEALEAREEDAQE